MKGNGHITEVGWLPRKDSYEEAVLSWYEQIESSFRRRRLDSHRARAERIVPREAKVEVAQAVFD